MKTPDSLDRIAKYRKQCETEEGATTLLEECLALPSIDPAEVVRLILKESNALIGICVLYTTGIPSLAITTAEMGPFFASTKELGKKGKVMRCHIVRMPEENIEPDTGFYERN